MSTTEPQPGDLIEIPRIGYKHWAVYVGDGIVVHLTVPDGSHQSSSSGSSGSFNSGSTFSSAVLGISKAVVQKDKLREITNNNWKVNNLGDQRWKPRDARVIVKEALQLVGTEQRYHLLYNNCEHFATKLRYGVSVSFQVLITTAVMLPVAIPAVVISGGAAVGAAVVGAGVVLFRSIRSVF